MSDEQKQEIKPGAENKEQSGELSEEELKKATGGKPPSPSGPIPMPYPTTSVP